MLVLSVIVSRLMVTSGSSSSRSSVGLAEDGLVARLRRGEPEALGDAYDLHHEAVRRYARQILGDEAAAEDAVHDAFVELPRAIQRFEGRSSLKTFLFAITTNVARHARRATARRLGAYERLHEEPRLEGESLDDESERRALAAVMERLLSKLPIEQRMVVVLCVVEEHTSTEVAEIMGVPEGTVRTRLFHARKKMRELLGDEVLR
ncbi:MAG: RNA polymerase sigma factor [Deltaproteobacteria bacterium]|nr:RNA polymerase sigma factor [Deltaproteobacteria bacterium]